MDRKIELRKLLHPSRTSLSARRAWIENYKYSIPYIYILVALRKESVDRKIILTKELHRAPPSLSARRAWIEKTLFGLLLMCFWPVALRKESVDRKAEDWLNAGSLPRRSPQGERG